MATMPDRKSTMTKEFMMLEKFNEDGPLICMEIWKKELILDCMIFTTSFCSPEPLDVGVRHGNQNVIPSRSPPNFIILLEKDKNKILLHIVLSNHLIVLTL